MISLHKMRTAVLVIFIIITETVCQVCDLHNSVELTDRSYNGVKYDEGEYIVDNSTGVAIERGCVCMKETCARKCCPFGQIYDESYSCIDSLETFNPLVLNNDDKYFDFKAFHFFTTPMSCAEDQNEFAIFLGYVSDEFYLKTDGLLHVIIKDAITPLHVYGPDKYCIDNFLESDNSTVKLNAFVCLPTVEETNHYLLNACCMLVSCFFILLTVSVYAFLPELRNTVPGIIMMAYLTNFFVGFLFMATTSLLLLYGYLGPDNCVWMAIFIYFFILAAFFWLNVMCYDLWWKFKEINLSSHGFSSTDLRRVLWYFLYAYGVPIILTVAMASLEFSGLSDNFLLPHLKQKGCFLYGTSRLVWLYSPMLILCVANIVFFVLVARRIAIINKQTARVQKRDSQRFIVYIKLFIVTGVNWVLEAVSSFFPDINYIWQFSDAYNALVGFIIFIIFVCKRKIYYDLIDRFKILTGRQHTTSETPQRIEMKSRAGNKERKVS